MFLPAALVVALIQPPAAAPQFEIKDGDRIVWIGNALVEREQRYGYWETALHAAFPDTRFTLRNLGWSGDTVHGEARGRFDFNNPDACFKQLVSLTLELKPTVVFVSYGTNESFEGAAGLPKFEKGLEKLLDALKPAKARVVLFTPMPAAQRPGTADVKVRNLAIAMYARKIEATAFVRKVDRADMFLQYAGAYDELATDNGVHLTEEGYRKTARGFLASLGRKGVAIDWKELDSLRQAIIAKNELFFHRWRPENETYLFGFRKHEQGKNAVEIAEFDPLVAKAEEEIEKLRHARVK